MRRLAQDNTQLLDTYTQGLASFKSDTSGLRKEMKGWKREQAAQQTFDNNRVWELSKEIGSLGMQLASLNAHVQFIQK